VHAAEIAAGGKDEGGKRVALQDLKSEGRGKGTRRLCGSPGGKKGKKGPPLGQRSVCAEVGQSDGARVGVKGGVSSC